MIEIPCKWCNAIFYDTDEHEEHAKEAHNKVPIYVCKKCNETLRGTMNFDRHLTLAHGTNHWDIHLGILQLKRVLKDLMIKK